MKLAVIWLCFLHLAFISAGLFTRSDLRSGHSSNVSVSRAQPPRSTGACGDLAPVCAFHSSSTGSINQARGRPLFARRGQYKRQRIHVPKPNAVPVAPKDTPPPSKVAPKPVKPKCSQLTQSCLPQSGCCDASVTCHCRFFNAICFCRRINS